MKLLSAIIAAGLLAVGLAASQPASAQWYPYGGPYYGYGYPYYGPSFNFVVPFGQPWHHHHHWRHHW